MAKPRITIKRGPHRPNEILVSLGAASALFDLSDSEFTRRYIYSGILQIDRLHQLSMLRVLWLAERLGVKKERPDRLSHDQEIRIDSIMAEVRREASI